MIAPNMATMLAFIATDLPMSQRASRSCSEEHRRKLQHDIGGRRHVHQRCGLRVCTGAHERNRWPHVPPSCAGLPRSRESDGRRRRRRDENARSRNRERATTRRRARRARDRQQQLVKTALYGEDPNWGRIVAAAGAVHAGLDPKRWSLRSTDKRGSSRAVELLSEAEAHRELEPELASSPARHRRCRGDRLGLRSLTRLRRINASYRT